MQTAGIGDPYWYEWTVGLINIIDMLDESSNIKSVTLQKSGLPGLDDVVVEYTDGPTKNYQVKHTRAGDTLTFTDLVSTKSKTKSLLSSLNEAWIARPNFEEWKAILFTNRAAGQHASNTQSGEYRPSLTDFWEWLSNELKSNHSLNEFSIPNEWTAAWDEWLSQLAGTNSEKLKFLYALEIRANEHDLQSLTDECYNKLGRIFGIENYRTKGILALLDSQLRVWTTSDRKNQRITREDVLQTLIKSNDLLPQPYIVEAPHPFFPSREKFAGEFEKLITDPTQASPVYFLCGDPGSGKSSLISYLTWRSEPAIDLRYFAFRPISPDLPLLDPDVDDAASPKRLWQGLLLQFQEILKNQLADARVPIIFEHLSVDDIRNHVLRLAAYYANKRNRDVIIAIDGLDHAARANRRNLPSFIDSLIPPDSIPQGVRFIIAGQAPEYYHEYPSWLSSDQVTRIDIPRLTKHDVLTLLKEKPQLTPINLEAIADVITDIADGNTLATVFSVAEAHHAKTPEKLREVLSEKKLKNGIETYYNHIWDTAVKSSSTENIIDKCASVLALSPSKITGEMLEKVFTYPQMPPMEWRSTLRKLQPLVSEDNNGFMIAHNDVRLFLEQKAALQKGWIKDIASLLADYHLGNNSSLSEKHASIFRLLGLAQRNAELPQVFTPEWVVEAASLQRSIHELNAECQAALDAAISNKEWKELISTLSGARTLERWAECRHNLSFQHYGTSYRLPPGFLISESRRVPTQDWTVDILNQLMTDILILIDSKRIDRATALTTSWLGTKSIEDVLTVCEDIFEQDNPAHQIQQAIDEKHFSFTHQVKYMLNEWGQIASQLQLYPLEPTEETDLYIQADFHFVQGALTAASNHPDKWFSTIDNLPHIYIKNIFEPCQILHEKKCWKEIAHLLKRCPLNKIQELGEQLTAWGSYWLLLANEYDTAMSWIDVFTENIPLNLAGRYAGSDQTLMVVIAFILGVASPEKESYAILTKLDKTKFCLQDELPTFRKLMLAATTAGRIKGAFIQSETINANALITPLEIANAVKIILEIPKLNQFPVAYFHIVNETLSMLTHSSEELSDLHKKALYNSVLPAANKFPAHDAMESIWRILEHHGNYQTLRNWAESCKPGTSWFGSLRYDERLEKALLFERLCRPQFPELADSFKEAANFSQIGYSSHKEYSLSQPLAWLQDLAKLDPKIWISHGVRLLALSRSISERGADNRESWEIEPVIAGIAAQCGPQHFASYLFLDSPKNEERWLEIYSPIICKSLTYLAEGQSDLQSTQALIWWSIAVGASRWFTKEDQYNLAKLRDALIAAFDSNDEKDTFISSIQQFTPAEASAEHKPEEAINPAYSQAPQVTTTLQLSTDLPISECLDILEINPSHTHFKRELVCVIERIKAEHPADYAHILNRVIGLSGIMNTSENWNWYSRTPIIHAVVPFLSDLQLWSLAETTLGDIGNDTRDYAPVNNLIVLAQAVANLKGSDLLDHGLKTFLDMHSTWFNGAKRICEAPELNLPDDNWSSWEDVAQSLFHLLLTSNSCETVAAALRGANVLLEAVPGRLQPLWHQASPPLRSWLLLLLEAWAVKHPDNVTPLSSSLISSFYDFKLEDRIQCAIILKELGIEPPKIFPSYPTHSSPLIRPLEQLLDIPPQVVGNRSYSQSYSSITGLLDRFHRILRPHEHALNLIEDCFARKAYASSSSSVTPYLTRRNDWLLSDQKWSHSFFECLDTICGEYNAPYHAEDLLQAVGSSDEPWQLIHSPRIIDADHWPNELPTDLKMRHKAIQDSLIQLIYDVHVPEEWLTIGATVEWYDNNFDYRLCFWHTTSSSNLGVVTVPYGRHALVNETIRYEPKLPQEHKTLTVFSGSITSFNHAPITVMPSVIWPTFGWKPVSRTRGIWEHNNQVIAKHESWASIARDNYYGPHHRHPHMQRWVVKSTALEQTGIDWHPHIDFQYAEYKL